MQAGGGGKEKAFTSIFLCVLFPAIREAWRLSDLSFQEMLLVFPPFPLIKVGLYSWHQRTFRHTCVSSGASLRTENLS